MNRPLLAANQKYAINLASIFLALFVISSFLPSRVSAVEIKDTTVEIRDDFVLEPAKHDLVLEPGEETTVTVTVTSRINKDVRFRLEIEDLKGTRDPANVVQLLGRERGPNSLKDFIKPEISTFTLKPKQSILISVNIAIPADAAPGGRYGSLLVSTVPDEATSANQSKAKTVSRLGALFFVRIAGDITEDGRLADFRLAGPKKPFYEKGPFSFETLFENNGSVHLTPSGNIVLKNMVGKQVGEVAIPPFFSLPTSLRAAVVSFDKGFMIGRYTATATVNRNYQEDPTVQDQMTISFWVLPWKIVVGVVLAILLLALFIRSIGKRFTIARK